MLLDAGSLAALPVDFLNGAAFAEPTSFTDYPDWHRGRSDYAVWLVLLDDPLLREYINTVRRELADILLPADNRALHITLQAAGFPCDAPLFDDDVPRSVLRRQAAALSQMAAFDLCLSGISAFQSALYVPVTEMTEVSVANVAGGLNQARAILNSHTPEIASAGYTPHVTIGLFQAVKKQKLARKAIWARLQRLGALPPLTIRVRELQLATYQARELQGPLAVVERITLR